jgi:hypothetical protein
MSDVADVVTAFLPTTDVSDESVAIVTAYRTAPTSGCQESRSVWVGNETEAPLAGVTNWGAALHFFVTDETDQRETAPVALTARTRHEYFPSGRSLESVACVFLVEKCPALPSTGELKAGSAAIVKS